jgi:hypothetical protein
VQRVKPCRRFPVALSLVYHGSGKRDLDNMDAHARKVILDALVQAGVIPDDGPKYVRALAARFKKGKDERIDATVVEPDKVIAGGDGLPGYSGGEICELCGLHETQDGRVRCVDCKGREGLKDWFSEVWLG